MRATLFNSFPDIAHSVGNLIASLELDSRPDPSTSCHLLEGVLDKVVKNERSPEQQEPPSLVDLSESDRREAKLLCKSLDDAARFVVVARDEHDATASANPRVAPEHLRRELVESLDYPRAAQLLSDDVGREPVPQVFTRVHRVDDDFPVPIDGGGASELME